MAEKKSISEEDLFGQGVDEEPMENNAVFAETGSHYYSRTTSEEKRQRLKKVDGIDENDGYGLPNGNEFTIARPDVCSNNLTNGHSILRTQRSKPGFDRSVSFQEDEQEVRRRSVNKERIDSEEAKERRDSYRRSSGYGTGSGESCSKSSNHSQDSQASANSSINHVFPEDNVDQVFENGALPLDKQFIYFLQQSRKQVIEQIDQEGNEDRLPLLSLFADRLDLYIQKEQESLSTLSSTKQFNTTEIHQNMCSSKPMANDCENLPASSILENAHSVISSYSKNEFVSVATNKSSYKMSSAVNSDDISVEVPFAPSDSLSESLKIVRERYCDNGPQSCDQTVGFSTSSGSGSSSSPWTGDFLWQFVRNDPDLLQEYTKDSSKFQNLFPNLSFNFSPSPNNSPSDVNTNQLQNGMKYDLPSICRCRDADCDDQRCNQIRTGMVGAKMVLNVDMAPESSPEIMRMLQAVYYHAKGCEETRFKCPVKMCHLFYRIDNLPLHDVPEHLVRQSVPLLTLKDFFGEDTEKFYKLSTVHKEDTIPDKDTVALVKFGDFGNVVLYCDDKGEDRIIKKVSKTDRDRWSFDSIYERLQNHNNPWIVPHLWFQDTPNNAYICTVFCKGGNLHECLQKKSFLIPSDALYLIKQILKGAVYLHHIGVVYLFWSATNILFTSAQRNHVQISNFSMSVVADKKFDVGFLQTSLPPCIVPPELVMAKEDATLSVKADSWGIGCLLGEMLTGKQMWHKYRHQDRNVIFKQVKDKTDLEPMTTKDVKKLNNELICRLLCLCWQKSPDHRIDTTELLENLSNNTL